VVSQSSGRQQSPAIVESKFPERGASAEQAAAYLGIGLSTLYTLAERNRIAHYRLGARGRGKLQFDRVDLDAFRASCRVEVREAEAESPAEPALSRRRRHAEVSAQLDELMADARRAAHRRA
jgi:excisionase family DNA binding protein